MQQPGVSALRQQLAQLPLGPGRGDASAPRARNPLSTAAQTVSRGWSAPEVRESLDLCLACKACSSDCPAGVDMAQYKSEGFHGETMRVEMTPADPNKYGFDLVFRMTETASAREVARGKVGVVFVARGERKVAPIPEPLRLALFGA